MKIRKIYIVLLIIVFIVTGYKLIYIKMSNDYKIRMNTPSTYSDRIGISIPKDSTVLDYGNDHGGFLGDGESYVIIKLNEKGKKEFLKEAKKNNKWSNMPLPEKYQKLVFGGESDNVDYGDGYFEDGGHIPRDIKNGIYYFRDRYAEKYPKEADVDINERYSYNFTISILDLDRNKLYIYELDT